MRTYRYLEQGSADPGQTLIIIIGPREGAYPVTSREEAVKIRFSRDFRPSLDFFFRLGGQQPVVLDRGTHQTPVIPQQPLPDVLL